MAAVAVLAATAACGGRAPASGAARPNIVVIVVDTLGANAVGSYGQAERSTPSIDRIARDGVRFAAESVAPWTAPALRSLLTSTYPSEHGYGSRWKLRENVPSLAETLAAAGYRTAAFIDADAPPLQAGFDTYECLFCTEEAAARRPRENLSAHPFDRALAWIGGVKDTPVFVFIHTYEAHDYLLVKPYQREAADRRYPEYAGPVREWRGEDVAGIVEQLYSEQLRSAASARYLEALYHAGVSAVDAEIGRFDDALRTMGRWSDTVVVVTGDHGEGFDPARRRLHHGGRLHEDLLSVPLVVRWPARLAPAAPSMRVSLIDVMPTLLALTGAPGPEGMRGLPLLRASPTWRSRIGLAPPPWVPAAVPERDLLAEESVYAIRPDGGRETSTIHQFALFALGTKLIYSSESSALFDLDADPGETSDRTASHPQVVAVMRERLGRLVQGLGRPAAVPDPDVLQVLRSLGYIR